MMRREPQTGCVVIELSPDDFDSLLICIGYAAGAAAERDIKLFYRWMRLANSVNDGNPDYLPAEILAGVEQRSSK